MPTIGQGRITSPYTNKYRPDHWGMDIAGPVPGVSSVVMAVADGTVKFIKKVPFRSGWPIGIEHPDGSLTLYGHMARKDVRVGQKVRRGQVIGVMGREGLSSSAGIHLHLEWWRDANNHYTHFEPMNRLGDYGWHFPGNYIGARLTDTWDGRATKNPTKTSTEKKEDLTVSDIKTILAELKTIKDDLQDAKNRIDAITRSKVVSWRDSTTGEVKKLSIPDAIGYLSVHWNRETERDKQTVTWRDSTTGETKQFTVEQAIGYLSLHWNREIERDIANLPKDATDNVDIVIETPSEEEPDEEN